MYLDPSSPTPAMVAQRCLGLKKASRPRTQRGPRFPWARPPKPAHFPTPLLHPGLFFSPFCFPKPPCSADALPQPGEAQVNTPLTLCTEDSCEKL